MRDETDRPVSASGYWQMAAAWVVPCFSMSILVSHSIWQSQISALLSKRLLVGCFRPADRYKHTHKTKSEKSLPSVHYSTSNKVCWFIVSLWLWLWDYSNILTVSLGTTCCGKHRWVSFEACCYAGICVNHNQPQYEHRVIIVRIYRVQTE